MRLRDALAVAVIAAVGASGCASMSKTFTFMRPDVSRKSFTQTAPDYVANASKRRDSVLAVNDRIALAEERLRTGEFDDAGREARAALKVDPKAADAYTILAVVAEHAGQSTQAGTHYAKAAELAPNRGGALNNYGVWLCANGRAAESLAWFDRALADPTYATPASARANAGSCAVAAGQDARGERDLRLALAQEPENPAALAAMARIQYQRGRYLEARAFSERRMSAQAPDADSLRLASQIEQKLGDNQAAARYLQQLAARFPAKETAQPGNTGTK